MPSPDPHNVLLPIDPDVVIDKSLQGRALDSPEVAAHLDSLADLPSFRSEFLFPPTPSTATVRPAGSDCIYLCGNSLGLQCKGVRQLLDEEMEKWHQFGVEGHFEGKRPWVTVDEICVDSMAKIVGAKPVEVCLMNTLSANLHTMMASFYRPTKQRFKILAEAKSFPSDKFVFLSQIGLHGLDPADALIEVAPRPGESHLRTEDILEVLRKEGQSVALCLFSGVQYYTGQFFECGKITAEARSQGCVVGWDLAHAVGNTPLKLHDWGVDFACWCTYKYLNSGPGGVGGCFVHERHADAGNSLPRQAGWWSHRKDDRFDMEHKLIYSRGAFGWQVSNPSVLTLTALRASLDLFDKTSMAALRRKSLLLTRYLERLLRDSLPGLVQVISPADPIQRGCQLSLMFTIDMEAVHARIAKEGVICDLRKPSVMRIAPAPMYNSFTDVRDFVGVLAKAVKSAQVAKL